MFYEAYSLMYYRYFSSHCYTGICSYIYMFILIYVYVNNKRTVVYHFLSESLKILALQINNILSMFCTEEGTDENISYANSSVLCLKEEFN